LLALLCSIVIIFIVRWNAKGKTLNLARVMYWRQIHDISYFVSHAQM